MTGYFEDLWASKGLDIKVPSFGTLSDAFACIPLETKQFCDDVAARLKRGEKIRTCCVLGTCFEGGLGFGENFI